MSVVRILSGGAAHGLVRSLAPGLKQACGFDIEGEFGAVGTMADRLRQGFAADLIVLTSALVAKLGEDRLILPATMRDVGLVQTGLAVRTGDPDPAITDAGTLRAALLAADAFYVPDTKASTAGIHIAKILAQLGIAGAIGPRLREHPNGATAMRALAQSGAARPLGCTQATEIIATDGVTLSGMLPEGCDLSTMYTAAITAQAAHPEIAERLIAMLSGPDGEAARSHAGFSNPPPVRPRATAGGSES